MALVEAGLQPPSQKIPSTSSLPTCPPQEGPPYFLSNGGITCDAGKMVSVHKGDSDKSRGPDANHEFNRAWLVAAQRVLKPNDSIWVSGRACNPNRAVRERNCLDSYLSGDYAARQFPVVPPKTVK